MDATTADRVFPPDARTVDQVQLAGMAQQVVQVQVFLPKALGVHVRHSRERFAQYQVLLVRQHWQVFHCGPGIGQALGTVKELEQQPAALAFLEAVGQ